MKNVGSRGHTEEIFKKYLENRNDKIGYTSGSLGPWVHGKWLGVRPRRQAGHLPLLQGIFPTQGSNLGLLHCQADTLPTVLGLKHGKEHVTAHAQNRKQPISAPQKPGQPPACVPNLPGLSVMQMWVLAIGQEDPLE